MVGNKSEYLDKLKKNHPSNYCSLCGCVPSHVIDHARAHRFRLNGLLYESLKYLQPRLKQRGFPVNYLLADNKTINPKFLCQEKKTLFSES